MTSESLAKTDEELRHLLDLADELQNTLDRETTRAYSAWFLVAGGAVLTVVATLLAGALEGGLVFTIAAVLIGPITACYIWLGQTLVRRPRMRRARRDERALSEVVRILRESLGVVERQGEWSALKRAEFRVRLARFQDTGDWPESRRSHRGREVAGRSERWSQDILQPLIVSATHLDVFLPDLTRTGPAPWEGLSDFFSRGGRLRLMLPDYRDEHLRNQFARWYSSNARDSLGQIEATIGLFTDLRIRGGADPESMEVRLSVAIPPYRLVIADHGMTIIGLPGAEAHNEQAYLVFNSSDTDLGGTLSREFERIWESGTRAGKPSPRLSPGTRIIAS